MPTWLPISADHAELNLLRQEGDASFQEISFYRILLDVDINGSVKRVRGQRITVQLPDSSAIGGPARFYETELLFRQLDLFQERWYALQGGLHHQIRLSFVVNVELFDPSPPIEGEQQPYEES